MLARFRPHITYANVMATVAVFLALGGGAYAVTSLPKNSVGTKQIKKHAVTSPKLAKSAVKGANLANGAVTGSKVASQSLTGHEIKAGTLGRVPLAAHATDASNATRVGGKRVTQFFFKGGPSSGGGQLLSVDGIVVKAGCDSSSLPTATVENDSGAAAAMGGFVSSSNATPAFTGIFSNNFGASRKDIIGSFAHGSGHFSVARSDGVVVSVTYSFNTDGAFGSPGNGICAVYGSAIAG